jgi:hypothetical protein
MCGLGFGGVGGGGGGVLLWLELRILATSEARESSLALKADMASVTAGELLLSEVDIFVEEGKGNESTKLLGYYYYH